MDLCTGRSRIWAYCTRPKPTPSRQMTSPISSRLWPVMPRKLPCRAGIFRSASPAKAGLAIARAMNAVIAPLKSLVCASESRRRFIVAMGFLQESNWGWGESVVRE